MASNKKSNYKEKMIRRKEGKAEETELPKYGNRAKERREDQNPDYEASELGMFHAVAPPGTMGLRVADAYKLSIEKSEYLRDDLEPTHLVNSLDYALPHKAKSKMRKSQVPKMSYGKLRDTKEDEPVSFRTATTKLVYQWMVKPQIAVISNDMFFSGTNGFYFQHGSSGKVLKKKKKDRPIKKPFNNEYDENQKVSNPEDEVLKNRSGRETLLPPLPLNSYYSENQGPTVARAKENDIFV